MRQIFVNGELDNSDSVEINKKLLTSTDQLTIGSYYNNSQFFSGFIDEVKIYPYARTEDQIKADYAAGLVGMGSAAGTATAFGGASDKWLSDGLVGYWKMDEASWDGTAGEVIDASGNSNHGVAANGATTGAGVFGNGGMFDGVNDYVNADMVSQISDKYTASAWIYPTRLEPQAETYGNTILATSSNYGIWLLHNNGAIRIHAFSSSTARYYQTTATPITLNKWHHVVVTAERNGEGKIFVDGELIENFTAENDTGWSGVLGIGDLRLDRGLTHQGAIDEVRIYNRALSSAEVKALYEWAPGPVAHYTFDDSSDSSGVADISGYGNNGTWYGSSTQRYGAGKYGSAGSFNGGSD
ncbi:LamG domain-containing protein, partial [Candidatus Micrarchaeota archaeon]|nr:LamG domain-containing protein [Candidatus Micrarchaeota archaeon]